MSDFAQPYGLRPPGSSVCGILQARFLEWVAMPSFQGIFLTQGCWTRICLLHWQASSLPLAPPTMPPLSLVLRNFTMCFGLGFCFFPYCAGYSWYFQKNSHHLLLGNFIYTQISKQYHPFHWFSFPGIPTSYVRLPGLHLPFSYYFSPIVHGLSFCSIC